MATPMKMKSYLQTVLVRRPGTDLLFITEAMRPVAPSALQQKLILSEIPIGLRRESDEAELSWWPEGRVVETRKDGVELTYWVKPTRVDAVNYAMRNPSAGGVFQFFSDGSVVARCYGDHYYWGPDVEVTAEEGAELYPRQVKVRGLKFWEFCDCCKDNPDYGAYDGYDSWDENDCRCYGRYCGDCNPDGMYDERN